MYIYAIYYFRTGCPEVIGLAKHSAYYLLGQKRLFNACELWVFEGADLSVEVTRGLRFASQTWSYFDAGL